MRLWHKDLIPVLPRQQLLGQWRECCLIAKNIAEKGTPNHLLVNKIMDYPAGHFWKYGYLVMCEMDKRGFKCDFDKFEQWIDKPYALITPEVQDLFSDWHNERYLLQCYNNLQEKYDCGGISDAEWEPIVFKVLEILYPSCCQAGVIVTDFNPDNPIIHNGNIWEIRHEL